MPVRQTPSGTRPAVGVGKQAGRDECGPVRAHTHTHTHNHTHTQTHTRTHTHTHTHSAMWPQKSHMKTGSALIKRIFRMRRRMTGRRNGTRLPAYRCAGATSV